MWLGLDVSTFEAGEKSEQKVHKKRMVQRSGQESVRMMMNGSGSAVKIVHTRVGVRRQNSPPR